MMNSSSNKGKNTTMKKNIIILILALCSLGANAQSTFRSSYFLDNMTMRHKLNPAQINDYGYFSIPVLGGLNFETTSNIGLSDFLYPMSDGSLATFMHPDVSADEFLSGFNKNNSFVESLDMTLFSLGFVGNGSYSTFDVSLKQNASLTIPIGYFDFMKNGLNKDEYNLSGLAFDATSYVDISMGHAREITDKLTVGLKVKVLLGLANANVELDDLTLKTSADEWMLRSSGTGNISFMGQSFINSDDEFEVPDTFTNMKLSGFGLGVDLGATYKLMDNLTLSAAITDLGFIRWNSANQVTISGEVVYTGFEDIDINDYEASTEQAVDQLTEDLEAMTTPSMSSGDSYKTSLYTTILVGGEYSMLDDMLSAGLLYTTTFGISPVTEFTASANFKPTEWFNCALTGTVSNTGTYWGWIVNFCPRGVNFYFGSDSVISSVTPQLVPVSNMNFDIHGGLSLTFGAKKK